MQIMSSVEGEQDSAFVKFAFLGAPPPPTPSLVLP